MKWEMYESFLESLQIVVWFVLAISIALNLAFVSQAGIKHGELKVYQETCHLEQVKSNDRK